MTDRIVIKDIKKLISQLKKKQYYPTIDILTLYYSTLSQLTGTRWKNRSYRDRFNKMFSYIANIHLELKYQMNAKKRMLILLRFEEFEQIIKERLRGSGYDEFIGNFEKVIFTKNLKQYRKDFICKKLKDDDKYSQIVALLLDTLNKYKRDDYSFVSTKFKHIRISESYMENITKKMKNLITLSLENISIQFQYEEILNLGILFQSWNATAYGFGNELIKLGIGYWIPYFYNRKHYLEFFIPYNIQNFIENIYNNNPNLKIKIDKFTQKLNNLEKEKSIQKTQSNAYKKRLIRDENYSQLLERDLEEIFSNNLDLIEPGLKLYERQYPTDLNGRIDILCTDKENNFVVIELKKDRASDKVAGQIQRYLTFIDEQFGEDYEVRGIIVANKFDPKLENSIKGSKYRISLHLLDHSRLMIFKKSLE